jgi:hypothetical protein
VSRAVAVGILWTGMAAGLVRDREKVWIASDDCEKRLPVQAERKKMEQPAQRVETRWPMRPRKVYYICDGPKKRTHSPERRVA